MVEKTSEKNLDRRDFLRTLAAVSVAATATGAGAAILMGESNNRIVTNIDNVDPFPPTIPPDQVGELTGLKTQLANAQAENLRLKTRLAAVEGQLELRSQQHEVQENADGDSWQLQLKDANTQIDSLSSQVALLAGLVALYEELDAVDLSAIVSDGIATVDSILSGVMDEIPKVSDSIQLGNDVLDEFEAQLPTIEEGQQWLSDQMTHLNEYYSSLEQAIEQAADVTGTIFRQLSQWFEDILKWLPFGLGNRSTVIMNSIEDLLKQIPGMVVGVQNYVISPLAQWFDKEEGETKLQRRVVRPLRQKALESASRTVTQIEALDSVYKKKLTGPVADATNRQSMIRQRITAYRESNIS